MSNKACFQHRIFCSAASHVTDDEILDANEVHTAACLKAISQAGFIGIWLTATLRELVPGELFGPYIRRSAERLRALQMLCKRASKRGLGVWLYLKEPCGLPKSSRFWKAHPELRGVPSRSPTEEPAWALCSSTPLVKEYLRDAAEQLFRRVPLAGTILITASEHVSHCWSHVVASPKSYPSPETFWTRTCACPRCKTRSPVDVVADIIRLLHEGVKSGRPGAKVVAWDWSWNMYLSPPYTRLIRKLPPEVILMGDFERGGKLRQAGKNVEVEEYSLSYPGPSRRFRSEAKAAGDR